MDQRRGPADAGRRLLNTRMFEETGDEQKSQGWTPFISTPTATASATIMSSPDHPVDPTKDKRVARASYRSPINPVDACPDRYALKLRAGREVASSALRDLLACRPSLIQGAHCP